MKTGAPGMPAPSLSAPHIRTGHPRRDWWYGYQDRATGELFAYSRHRLQSLPKTVLLVKWRTLPAWITERHADPS